MTPTVAPRDRFADIKTATLHPPPPARLRQLPLRRRSLLATLTAATHATTVVELGAALGYSAAWLASTGAHVHTTSAQDHLARHHLADHVTLHTGEGTDVLPSLPTARTSPSSTASPPASPTSTP